jgi:Ca2+-binding RTX toxin-like protein
VGGNGNDTLIGGGGADVMYGGRGNDTISGGPGDDTLGGGGDHDLFLLGRGFGHDTVADFGDGDRIAVEAGVSWRVSGNLVLLDDGSRLQLLGQSAIAGDWVIA